MKPQITTNAAPKQVNGRLILEGALRIYWGVRGVIHLKEDDDQRTVVTARNRNSCRHSVTEVRCFYSMI